MVSLSKTDIEALTFLIRNFSNRFTVRQLASKLGVTGAGLHQGLKKLEEENLVKSVKLGTGLFYEINYSNEAAQHLAAFCIALKQPPFPCETFVIVKNKRGVSFGHTPVEGYDITPITRQIFLDKLRNRDEDILDLIRSGTVAKADLLVQMIKEVAPRW